MTLLELAEQIGLEPKWVASSGGGEYHSSCPRCGGNDRFRVQPNKQAKLCSGYYACRQCDASGDTIQFAREFLHKSFNEAVEMLGADLPAQPLLRFNSKKRERTFALIKQPPQAWLNKALSFSEWAHNNLLQNQELIELLSSRGIPLEAIKEYKIGWNLKDLYRDRKAWGILFDENHPNLWLPEGIVIPTINQNKVVRLKIRRTKWEKGDELPKYLAVSGSMNGLNIFGLTKREIMIVVESELDAIALNHALHDRAFIIAVGNNIKNPDNVVNHLAQAKQQLFICHDNDEAGERMLNKWQALYPHAQACTSPEGKDIGEAIQQGLDPRAWFLKLINDGSLVSKENRSIGDRYELGSIAVSSDTQQLPMFAQSKYNDPA